MSDDRFDLNLGLDHYDYDTSSTSSFNLDDILKDIESQTDSTPAPKDEAPVPEAPSAPKTASVHSAPPAGENNKVSQKVKTPRPVDLEAIKQARKPFAAAPLPAETPSETPAKAPINPPKSPVQQENRVKLSKPQMRQQQEPAQIRETDEMREDRETARSELVSMRRKINVKTGLMTVLLLFAAYLFAGGFADMLLPASISPLSHTKLFLFIGFAVSAFALIINIIPLAAGLRRLFHGQINPDGALLFFGISVLLSDIYFWLHPAFFLENRYTFDGLFVLFLLVGLRRKAHIVKRALIQFDIVTDKRIKSILSGPKNVAACNDVMAEVGLGADVLYAAKAERVVGFIRQDFLQSDRVGKPDGLQFWLSLVIALLCGGSFLIGRLSAGTALMLAAAGLAMILPCFAVGGFALSGVKLAQKLARGGTAVTGEESAKTFLDAGILVVNEEELITYKDVQLHGMKLVQNCDVKTVLTALSALFSKIGGCLDGFFSGMFEQEDDIVLPEAKNILYYENCGYGAKISGSMLLVGSCQLMKKMKVAVPEITPPQGGSVIYCAMNGKLCAVFSVCYQLPEKSKKALELLDKKNISVALIGANYQFDEQFYTEGLNLQHPEHITVLSFATACQCREHCAVQPKAQAQIVSCDGLHGLALGLLSFDKMLSNTLVRDVFRIVAAVFATLFIGVAAFRGIVPGVYLPLQMLVYPLLWSLPIYLTGKINRF